ncbi:hypothetical protein OG943_01420 [Amycolatopsis sp. NBC_00345]|uniref:hypothetical protein n=1 Tax=Amycolatopsis sp. NBC_00345 TaxID=2975955 RepID=UPI002E26C2C1
MRTLAFPWQLMVVHHPCADAAVGGEEEMWKLSPAAWMAQAGIAPPAGSEVPPGNAPFGGCVPADGSTAGTGPLDGDGVSACADKAEVNGSRHTAVPASANASERLLRGNENFFAIMDNQTSFVCEL